jgi:hypothetical protein
VNRRVAGRTLAARRLPLAIVALCALVIAVGFAAPGAAKRSHAPARHVHAKRARRGPKRAPRTEKRVQKAKKRPGKAARATAEPAPTIPPMISATNGFAASKLPPAEFNNQLAAMAVQGVRVVRADAPWADIEPNPPGPSGYDWQFSETDALETALAEHHLTWEPLIDFSVWWAKRCSGFCAPTSDSTYATFAQAIAARYGAGGSFWKQHPQLPYYPAQIFEIWDEENSSSFYIDPATYAGLYLASRQAIDAVDPSAQVIVGGLADDSGSYTAATDYPSWYVIAMFAADPQLRGNVDGFGLHPYGTSASDVVDWVVDFRRTLETLGEDSVPIDITEVGWETGDSARENWRESQMREVAADLAHSNCGVRLLAPYDWVSPQIPSEPGDFGLVDPTGTSTTLRPAGVGWFHGLSVAISKPEQQLCGSAVPLISSSS